MPKSGARQWAIAGLVTALVTALLGLLAPVDLGAQGIETTETPSPPQAQEPTPTELRWLEATPLDSREEARVFAPARADEPLDLEPGRWMLCAGGEGLAVQCRPWLAPGPSPADSATRPVAAPGAQVAGTVLVGGRTVADARITVAPVGVPSRRPFTLPLTWNPKDENLVRSVVTGEDGSFLLPPLAPGDYRLEIVPPGGRILPTEPFSLPSPEELLPRDQDPATTQAVWHLGELAFDAGMRVEVRVTDATGAPIPGARVGGSQGDSPETTVFFETEADEEGVAVLSGLDPAAPARLVCVAEGYVRMSGRFEVPPASIDCTLEALAEAEGRVVDENDEPVTEAVVRLLETQGDPKKRVSTDETGRYHLDKLVAGSYELEASAPGFRRATLSFQVEPGAAVSLDTLVLSPGETFTGEVFEGTTGEPIAGAQVELLQISRGDRTTTDADGFFELRADPDGALRVKVEVPGYPVHREGVPVTAFETGEPVRIEIWPGGRIQVVAWDEAGDGLCVGCEFAISGSQGRFKLVTDAAGRALSEPLAPERYSVQGVQAHSTGSVVFVSSGQDVKWAEVEAEETVTVTFGEPTQVLRVLLDPAPPADWELTARGPGWTRFVEPEGAGVFPVRRAEGERVELTLGGPHRERLPVAKIPASFDEDVFEVSLPAGRVHGRLVMDGEHAAGPAAARTLTLLDATQGARRATVTTDAGGRFAVPFLPAGTYHLALDLALHLAAEGTRESTVLRTFAVSGGADVALGEITLENLGEKRLER